MKKPNAFILMGRSGCGKGTQVKLLIDYLNKNDCKCKTIHIESGSLLRDYAKGDSFAQNKCREIMNSGGLIPEFLVVGLWANKLISELTGRENIVCDGTPRKIHEAHILDSVFGFFDFDKPKVVLIDVSRDWSMERLLARKRADDTREDIESRLNWFDTEVSQALDLFRNNPNYDFIKINGEQSIEDVHKEIMTKLGYK
jgi:adenylate kinase